MRQLLQFCLPLALAAASHAAPADRKTLKAGGRAHGFEAIAVYLDAADRPLGARLDWLFARKDRVNARVLPGYDTPGLDTAAGGFFVIGPDRKLDAWEQYLQATAGARPQPLQRLYARDFWMP